MAVGRTAHANTIRPSSKEKAPSAFLFLLRCILRALTGMQDRWRKIAFQATGWLDRTNRRLAGFWSGLTILIVSEDSAAPPHKMRINYFIIIFLLSLFIFLPLSTMLVVSQKPQEEEALSRRIALFSSFSTINRQKGPLLRNIMRHIESFQDISNAFQGSSGQSISFKESAPADNAGDAFTSELEKIRSSHRNLSYIIESYTHATSFVWHRLYIHNITPRGLPVHARDFLWAGKYGWRLDPETNARSEFHTGADIIATRGKKVLATAPGEVIEVVNESDTGYGLYVRIHHGLGITSLYAHNSENHVEVGDRVQRGQVIGLVGATGRAIGAHVHYEVQMGAGYTVGPNSHKGLSSDPAPYLQLR
jgi:murein DD-endopeptidase MepM/ murein hydrolase activator NlpD